MNTLYENWMEAKKELTHWKEKEMKLRLEIVGQFIDKPNQYGTSKFDDDNYRVKIAISMSTSFDEEILDQLWETLPEHEKNAVRFKPSLIKREYDKLDEPHLAEALITKAGCPTLSISNILEDE